MSDARGVTRLFQVLPSILEDLSRKATAKSVWQIVMMLSSEHCTGEACLHTPN